MAPISLGEIGKYKEDRISSERRSELEKQMNDREVYKEIKIMKKALEKRMEPGLYYSVIEMCKIINEARRAENLSDPIPDPIIYFSIYGLRRFRREEDDNRFYSKF